METTAADPPNGTLIAGRYRIMGRLAQGGTATVYHAHDERLERTVAIKIINSHATRDPRTAQHFADEARLVAQLTHPNIVAVYDQGTHNGAPYLVMEYVRGRTLRELIGQRGTLHPIEALAIMEQILAALSAAHRAGLVHRDVKPENVLIAMPPNGSNELVDSVVKVADFGLAGTVRTQGREGDGTLLATPAYVAPELVSDGRADSRVDVYSAGIVLFEMLTGRVPFDGAHAAAVAWQHVDYRVPPPSRLRPGLPAGLDRVVGIATARDPASRPWDAGALLTEVQAARESLAALTAPTQVLDQPTMMVPPVDARPPWARLNTPPRRPERRPRPTPIATASQTTAAWAGSVRGWVDQTTRTAQGRNRFLAAGIAVVLVLIASGWWVGFGRYDETPALLQLTKANAVAEATRLGFTLSYAEGRFSEQIPLDTVVDQRPAPGERIVSGGAITLVLSLGPERYPVPDVVGQAADFAGEQLKEHFTVQTVSGYSDTIPVNYVVSVSPAVGTPLKPKSVVKVTVSKGPPPVHVPTVIGKSLAEAEAALRAMGFGVDVQRKDDQTKPRDTVLSQTPEAGKGLTTAKGVTVVLVVANGPAGTPMPDLTNQPCAASADALRALGLQVDVKGNVIAQQFGRVEEQNPRPGEPTQPGQQVRLRCKIG